MAKALLLGSVHPVDDKRVRFLVAHQLLDAGWKVDIVGAPARGSLGPSHHRLCQVPVEAKNRRARLLKSFTAAIKARPDVLLALELDSWLVGWFIVITSRMLRRKIRLVFDCHEHYPSRAYERFRERSPILGLAAASLVSKYMEWMSVRTDAIVAASSALAAHLSSRRIVSTVIENIVPVELSAANRPVVDMSEEPPTLGHLGVLDERLNWEVLLEALRQPEIPRLRFKIVGGSELPPDAKRQFASLAPRVEVRILGWLPRPEAFDEARECDALAVFFNNHSYNNTLGSSHKFFDALQLGIPIVAPNFRGFTTAAVKHGVRAHFFDPTNAKSLALAIAAAVRDGTVRDPQNRSAEQSFASVLLQLGRRDQLKRSRNQSGMN